MKNSKLIGAGVGGALIAGFFIVFLTTSGGGTNNFGNVSTLSFLDNHSDLNCEAFNKLGVTKNGVFSTVASGRDGFNPVFDSNLLTITQFGEEIDSFHIQLWLSCKGNFFDDSSAVTVSGNNNLLLCGDPRNAGTTCLLSDDRRFQQLNGVAVSTTQFNSFVLGSFALPDDTETLIYQGNMRADDLERIFPSGVGDITFTSRMLPQLTLTFNHDTKGIFTATYDALASNDIVYAQYSGLASNAPPPPDSDGDGFIDTEDGCINQPETVNGFQDEDGCPDEVPDDPIIDDVCDRVPDDPSCTDDIICTAEFDPVCDVDTNTNYSNQCFATGAGATNTIAGICEGTEDSDRDGVPDVDDLCPFTSPTAIVDTDGCTVQTLDVGSTVDDSPTVSDESGDGSLDLPPPLFDPDVQQPFQPTAPRPTVVAPSSAPDQFFGIANLAFSDVVIFGAIGVVVAVIAVIIIRRR